MTRIVPIILTVCATLVSIVVAAGEPSPAVTIRYGFEESDGLVVKDDGPLQAHGTLSRLDSSPVEDCGIVTGETDQWQPILRQGVQVKNIVPKSDRLLLDTEAPVVFDRDVDYAIDYGRGLLKPLPGGRMSRGERVSVGLTYAMTGPTRVAGRTDAGKALAFNGQDAYVDCGEPKALNNLAGITIDLWFKLDENWNRNAILVSRGDGLSLAFEKGAVVFQHTGLSVKTTKSATPPDLTTGAWHQLLASWKDGLVTVKLNGKEIARNENVTGRLKSDGPLRLGGAVDPHWFAGAMDDLTISLVAAP